VKTFLILVLSTLLAIGAFLSRPTEQNFRAFVRGKLDDVPGALGERGAAAMEEGVTYHDRWVYSTIEVNGKTVYAGVFSRWFAIPESSSGQSETRGAGVTAF
jgi:hypothetical protein